MRTPTVFVAALLLWMRLVSAQTPLSQSQTPAEDSNSPTEALITPAGAALSTIFSPAKAPQQKTMGLLQRSFLDLADQGDAELELAIVVDGTDSMAADMSGVRNGCQPDDRRSKAVSQKRGASGAGCVSGLGFAFRRMRHSIAPIHFE